MGKIILISGKGGTGKTTLTALLVKVMKEKRRGSILAIDADPNANLAEALGLGISETIADIVDKIKDSPNSVPKGMSKDDFINYRIQTCVTEAEGFDLLAMGRPEGAGCYCYVNNVLKNVIVKLIKEYDYIIIDNAAGLEHLSRRLTDCADLFIIVTDPTVCGLRAASRIRQLRKELKIKIKKEFLIVNRIDARGPDLKKINDLNIEYLGNIPEDAEITTLSMNGGSLFFIRDDTPALMALIAIEDRLWQKNT